MFNLIHPVPGFSLTTQKSESTLPLVSAKKMSNFPLQRLPVDLLGHMASFLENKDLAHLKVNKDLNEKIGRVSHQNVVRRIKEIEFYFRAEELEKPASVKCEPELKLEKSTTQQDKTFKSMDRQFGKKIVELSKKNIANIRLFCSLRECIQPYLEKCNLELDVELQLVEGNKLQIENKLIANAKLELVAKIKKIIDEEKEKLSSNCMLNLVLLEKALSSSEPISIVLQVGKECGDFIKSKKDLQILYSLNTQDRMKMLKAALHNFGIEYFSVLESFLEDMPVEEFNELKTEELKYFVNFLLKRNLTIRAVNFVDLCTKKNDINRKKSQITKWSFYSRIISHCLARENLSQAISALKAMSYTTMAHTYKSSFFYKIFGLFSNMTSTMTREQKYENAEQLLTLAKDFPAEEQKQLKQNIQFYISL